MSQRWFAISLAVFLTFAGGAEAASREFRVVTYNLKRQTDLADLQLAGHALVREASPDVVLLQEVRFNDRGWNSAEVLANAMGYDVFAAERRNEGEGVAILSRLPLVRVESLQLDGANPPFFWHRVSAMAEVVTRDGLRARVVSTHLPNFSWEDGTRARHIEQTLDWASRAEHRAGTEITIFGGDLNAAIESDEVQSVLSPSRWLPLRLFDFNASTPTHGSRRGPKTKRLDYLFASIGEGQPNFESEQVLFSRGIARPSGERLYLSDHLPVLHVYRVD